MSYEDVVCCDDVVRLFVCFCVAAAIPSCVFADRVPRFVWFVCFVLDLGGCGT